MEITWLGHSCFRLKGSHAVLITDPCAPELGYNPGKQSAGIVTVSHQHPGHNYVQGIGGEPRVVRGPGEYEISGVLILGVATFHDNTSGGERGKNTAFLMEIDGISILHLGDIGHQLSAAQVEEIGPVDVLLVPVGGASTIDAAAAAEMVRELGPMLVVPMHYRTPDLKVKPDAPELEGVDRFLKEMGLESVEPRPKLSVTRSNLPASSQVVLLGY